MNQAPMSKKSIVTTDLGMDLDTYKKSMLDNSNKHYSLDDNILYFLHIPKTAGTTFTFNLDSYYDVQNIYPERVLSGFLKNPPSNFLSLKLIRGHFGYKISKFLEKPPLFLTFLRNPIERTLSFFDHIKLDPYTNNWVNQNFILNETISDLLVDETKSKIFTNNQTRHIANDLDYTKLNDSNNFLLEEHEQFVNPKLTDEQLITLAKKRLSEFAFVGLTEKTNESLLLFCYTFNLQPLGNFWNLMVAPKRTHINDFNYDTINQIKKLNNLDFELYEFAKKIFDYRYSKMLDDFKNLFPNKKFSQGVYDFLDDNYKKFLNYPLQNSVNYDFSEKFNGRGWYYRETIPETGNYFRWTGPSTESIIDFHLLQNKEYVVEFSVIDYVTSEQLENFQLFVNENKILLKKEQKENKVYFQGFIPESYMNSKEPFTRLKLKISKVKQTNLTNLSLSDSRLVGLAFDNIKIFPNKK